MIERTLSVTTTIVSMKARSDPCLATPGCCPRGKVCIRSQRTNPEIRGSESSDIAHTNSSDEQVFFAHRKPEYKKMFLFPTSLRPLRLHPRLLVTTPSKLQLHKNLNTNCSSIKLLPQTHRPPSWLLLGHHTFSPTTPTQAIFAALSDVKSQAATNTPFQEQDPAPKKYNKHTSDTFTHRAEESVAEAHNKLLHHHTLPPPLPIKLSKKSKHHQHIRPLLLLQHQRLSSTHCFTKTSPHHHRHQSIQKLLQHRHQTTTMLLLSATQPQPQPAEPSFQVTASLLCSLVALQLRLESNSTTLRSKL